MANGSNWYAVFCKPRQENRAEEHLENQGFRVLAPRVRARRRLRGRYRAVIEPMFPRYLFVRLEAFQDDWSAIRSTRGVAGLVRFGDEIPVVPEAVIELITRRTGAEGWVDLARIEDFKPGERVRIAEGPFAGYEALFQARTGAERVLVLLDIMQREQRLEIPEVAIARA